MKLTLETENPKLLALLEELAKELGVKIYPKRGGSLRAGAEPGHGKEPAAQNSAKAIEALKKLAALGAFRDIEDPVEWQREIRKDRPLPGRDD